MVVVATVTGAVLGAVLGAVTKNVVDLLVKLGQKRFEQWKGLQADIQSIKSELVLIVAEEEDQLLPEGRTSAVKSRFMEVMRDLAHDIEDFLDRISRFADSEGVASPLQRIKAVGSRAGSHPFATEVEQLKKRLEDAHKLKISYKVNDGQSSAAAKPAAVTSSTYAAKETVLQPVGIDKPKQEVLKLVHNIDGRRDHLKVISIVGFAGSGKSTLAKAVYDSPDVVGQFSCRAWVVASKRGRDTKGLLTALLEDLDLGDRAKGDVQQLQAAISDYLSNKRYLIVLDDIKELQWWDGIKSAFPETTTSTIIVTTTMQTVARFCSHGNGYVHDVRALEGKDSKELLKAVLKGHLPGLEERSTLILNKCDGHPLALVAVANYLLMMSQDGSAERDCEQLCRSLGLRMATEDAFKELCEVLINSYSSLPNDYHKHRHLRNLKTCLLYLCVFPNGCHIRGSRLMRRWFAEKYVQDEYPLSNLEIANDYFKKLLDPNIIRPVDSSKHEEVKTWRAHGIMHEFMLHMSTSAKFITSHQNPERSNYRHLFIQNTSRGRASGVDHHGTSGTQGSTSGTEKFRAHSLTICGSAGEAVADFAKCELLRVLDLEECNDLKDEHLDGIHELWYLRYLSLGVTISRLPKDIQKLYCLVTLDVRKTKKEIMLPVEVIKLPNLAHLLGRLKLDKRKWDKCNPENYLPEKSNLQTLAGFLTDQNPGFPKLMPYMKQLRRVKIWRNSTGEDPHDLQRAIESFVQAGRDTCVGIRSLSLDIGNSSGIILRSLEYGYLSTLKLQGELKGMVQFVKLLYTLKELYLSSTNGLTNKDLSDLRRLKTLEYLKLVQISLEDLVIRIGDFPRLLRLCLVQCRNLPTMDDGALPHLLSLRILDEGLDDVSGIKIEQHKLLQELALDSEVNEQIKKEWEDAAKNHPKRPEVLYLKRVVEADGTGSTVKYAATMRAAPGTGSSFTQEAGEISMLQSSMPSRLWASSILRLRSIFFPVESRYATRFVDGFNHASIISLSGCYDDYSSKIFLFIFAFSIISVVSCLVFSSKK